MQPSEVERTHLLPIPKGAFLIEDFSDQSRSKFFAEMEKKISYISARIRKYIDESGDVGIATLDYRTERHPLGFLIKEAEIYITEEAFFIGDQDYRYLIPITIEHEITEAWVDLQNFKEGMSREEYRAADGIGHKSGVLAEYMLAHKKGLAERYLSLVELWAQQMDPDDANVFWQENLEAYYDTQPQVSNYQLKTA